MPGFDTLDVAISSCPNDTFAFYHFLKDTGKARPDVAYNPVFLDIEELNLGMLASKWDIVKASFTVGLEHPDYELLPSGSAIGFGVGPIAVYANEDLAEKKTWRVGLPGKNTTAGFLWNFYTRNEKRNLPAKIEKEYMHFGRLLDETRRGGVDLGILIHEGRFVYKNFELRLYVDLGQYWQDTTGFAVPLGGIFIKKNIPEYVKEIVKKQLRQSVVLALRQKKEKSGEYLEEIIPYIKKYSQESSVEVIEQHIDTYVTADTVELGPAALEAIQYFHKILKEQRSI